MVVVVVVVVVVVAIAVIVVVAVVVARWVIAPNSHQNATKWTPKSNKINSKIHQNDSKIHQVGLQNPPSWSPKSKKNESWEGLGAILTPRGTQDATKLRTGRAFAPPPESFRPLLATHFGSQNPPKIDFLGFQEVLIFMFIS